MAFDEELAARVREQVSRHPGWSEKRMFGGIAFLVDGNMAVGVSKDDLMVRVGPTAHADALSRPGARVFDMTGRPSPGWPDRSAGSGAARATPPGPAGRP